MKLKYSRLIKALDFELFNVQKNSYDFESLAFILFIDTKRKSKLSDFPILAGIETEEEFDSSSNHIKVLQISPSPLSQEYMEDIMSFTESMLSHTIETSFYIHEVISDINAIEFSQLDLQPLLNFIDPFIKDIRDDKNITKLETQSFKFLTQTL